MNLLSRVDFVFYRGVLLSIISDINETNVVSANFFVDVIIALIIKFALYFIDIVVR